MFSATCTDRQKITINANPDGKLDGPLRVTITSGDGTVEQDPATPNSFKAVSGTAVFDPADPTSTAGQTVYHVAADVRSGPDEVLIEEDVVLTVTAQEATSLGFTTGAVEPK